MRVLELCCGYGGWSMPFTQMGIECHGIDNKDFSRQYPGKFIKADIMDWKPEYFYDIILASPPCTEFSIAKKFGYGTQDERIGLDLVYRVFNIIEEIHPRYWLVENVPGLKQFFPKPAYEIAYDHKKNTKRACLWTNIRLDMLHPMRSYRKQDTIAGHQKPLRAVIPLELASEVAKAVMAS